MSACSNSSVTTANCAAARTGQIVFASCCVVPCPMPWPLTNALALSVQPACRITFGEQRFGRRGSNIALANVWAEGKRLPRHKRSIAISAARSYLFNAVLDQRVRDKTWNRILAGDVANLDGSASVFQVGDVDEELTRRCELMDIHPAGPLFGEGTAAPCPSPEHDNWIEAFAKNRVEGANRSLRLRVSDLNWSIDGDRLQLEFGLGRGAFATSVLREIAEITAAN